MHEALAAQAGALPFPRARVHAGLGARGWGEPGVRTERMPQLPGSSGLGRAEIDVSCSSGRVGIG